MLRGVVLEVIILLCAVSETTCMLDGGLASHCGVVCGSCGGHADSYGHIDEEALAEPWASSCGGGDTQQSLLA